MAYPDRTASGKAREKWQPDLQPLPSESCLVTRKATLSKPFPILRSLHHFFDPLLSSVVQSSTLSAIGSNTDWIGPPARQARFPLLGSLRTNQHSRFIHCLHTSGHRAGFCPSCSLTSPAPLDKAISARFVWLVDRVILRYDSSGLLHLVPLAFVSGCPGTVIDDHVCVPGGKGGSKRSFLRERVMSYLFISADRLCFVCFKWCWSWRRWTSTTVQLNLSWPRGIGASGGAVKCLALNDC